MCKTMMSMFCNLYNALKLHVSNCVNYYHACTYYVSDEHRVPRDVSAEGPFPYIVTHKEGQVRVPCKMSSSL